MGKFEIAAIFGGIAILFFYSQLEVVIPAGHTSSATQRPNTVASAGAKSQELTDVGDVVELWGQRVTNVFDAVSVRAIDGDSLEATLTDGTSREIRLASIDAPERNQKSGRAAEAHLADLVRGQAARIFQTDTDRYDRTVAFVLTKATGTDVNATMVSDGLAWHAIA
jgi:endonuclease YncB( thermonuclease family)